MWDLEHFASADSLTKFINKKELKYDEFKIVIEPRRPDDFYGGSYYTLFYLKK